MLFAIYATDVDLEETERMAKESDMTYVETETLSVIEKMLLGVSPVYTHNPIYAVIVEGSKCQFDNLVNKNNEDLTKIF